MMRTLEMPVIAAAVVASMTMIAESTPYEPLSQVRGQALVKDAFHNVPFWTGAWGNDVSFLLPFQWSTPDKRIFTYFSAAEHKFSDGRAWELDEIDTGRLRYCKHDWSPDVDIWFEPEQLFEVEFFSKRRVLCYHNERMRGSDAETDGVGFIEDFIWNELSVSTNGWPNKTLLKGWPSALFADGGFKSISSVVPLKFRGAKAETVQEKDEICKRLDGYSGTQSSWGIAPLKKRELASIHHKYVRDILLSNDVSTVYLIACDANHDGICDAYASSDAERVGVDKYRWSLYLGGSSGFTCQKEAEKFSVNRSEDLYFETDVVAAKDDFFRVDRIKMPAYVMVLTELDGYPESWSYVYHDSPVKNFRSREGFSNAEFFSCLKCGKPGVASIRDMFLSYYALIRAERLECEPFHDE